MISESTRFLAHPNEIMPTEMGEVFFSLMLTWIDYAEALIEWQPHQCEK